MRIIHFYSLLYEALDNDVLYNHIDLYVILTINIDSLIVQLN